jgi:hypothetical protein
MAIFIGRELAAAVGAIVARYFGDIRAPVLFPEFGC